MVILLSDWSYNASFRKSVVDNILRTGRDTSYPLPHLGPTGNGGAGAGAGASAGSLGAGAWGGGRGGTGDGGGGSSDGDHSRPAEKISFLLLRRYSALRYCSEAQEMRFDWIEHLQVKVQQLSCTAMSAFSL